MSASPRVRWQREGMDAEYLDRLEPLVQPDGDMATRGFRYGLDAGPELDGEVAIWQVELRGDDVLELIRLARIGLAATAYREVAEYASRYMRNRSFSPGWAARLARLDAALAAQNELKR